MITPKNSTFVCKIVSFLKWIYTIELIRIHVLRCIKHNMECPRECGCGSKQKAEKSLGQVILDMLIAGSACTDFSAYGSSQHSAGPTMVYLLLLLRMVLEYQPDIMIHENVLQFPARLLEECLHGLYLIQEFVRSPDVSGSGFPISRNRKYLICRKENTVQCFGCIYTFWTLWKFLVKKTLFVNTLSNNYHPLSY